ncbi:hypothetical protein FB45DRAFT_893744 [Roridomyces roridus]|uniref:Uncharacterized protein n=1 Tax=Roridomyces roridus TaxID=1738132 RepID=A0AAD7G083_9AGAR|nr:hypothetical protein FB45DRAFT_893744 [Roridomyces roridus]
MPANVIANFGVLDELVQVIYQGMDKFVLLSDVSNGKWNVHLGLTGSEGRWWSGSWRDVEVFAFLGKSATDTLVESFAKQLANAIIEGELYVEKGERYQLTLNPTSDKPKHVALQEMSSKEAACYAADVFAVIALQAQSRQSRLNPSPLSFSDPPSSSGAGKRKAPADDGQPVTTGRSRKGETAVQRHASPEQIANPAPVARPLKGASLANPNKKARKFQRIEYDD